MSAILGFFSFICLGILIVGFVQPSLVKIPHTSRKNVLLVFGPLSIILFALAFAIPSTQYKQIEESGEPNQSPQGSPPSQSSPQKILPATENISAVDASISEQIASYQLPLPTGQWRSCITERINTLDNVQLLSFYEWVKSLSSHSSELTILAAISRKLGCPEPTEKVIPAKTALIKSWSGIGSHELGILTLDTDQWDVWGSWSGGETKEIPINGEERMFMALSDDRGIFLCDPTGQACSVLAFGFDKPSGSFSSIAPPEKGTFYFKIGAPPSASWSLRLEEILEPAKTIVE